MITIAPAPADAGTPATSPPAGAPGLVAWYAEGFSDVLGDRLHLFDNAGPALELLRFSPLVATRPGFESAVRARINALAALNHPAFAKIRALRLLDDPQPQLALVSELVAGERLSTVLRAANARGARLDPTCAIWLLRQLLPALAAFHDATGGAQHRLLDADRVVLTPTGALAITEYVFGGLAEDLLPAPRTSDVGQSALLAIAMLRGYVLRPEEREGDFERLVDPACATSPAADVLRPWLTRALSLGSDRFRSAREAYHALDELLPGVWGNRPSSRDRQEDRAALSTPLPGPVEPAPRRRLWQLALPPAPAPANTVARRLWRANRTLALVATVEAVCIVALIARVALSGAPFTERSGAPTPSQAALGLSIPEALPLGPPVAVTLPPEAAALLISSDPPPVDGALAVNSVTGWLVIESEAEVKVYVNGRLLGRATRRRFGVPAGEHLVTLASDTSGFRSTQTIRIAAGRSVLVAAKPSRR